MTYYQSVYNIINNIMFPVSFLSLYYDNYKILQL